MLRVLHLLCNASPKHYRELKRFAEAWQISIAKPTKATGTSWIEHKINAMNIALKNYCAFLSHIESLSPTDSKAITFSSTSRLSSALSLSFTCWQLNWANGFINLQMHCSWQVSLTMEHCWILFGDKIWYVFDW